MPLGKNLATAVVVVIGIAFVPTARAERLYVYAHDLSRLCTSGNLIDKSWCEGFISGELEVISNGPLEGVVACVPPLMTLPQGIEIAKKWVASHPEESIRSASSVVAQAFANAFPCKK